MTMTKKASLFQRLVWSLLGTCIITNFQTTTIHAATDHYCSSVEDIRNAMSFAEPGDEIIVAPGTYAATDLASSGNGAHFASTIDGSPSNRITLRSEDPSNMAILKGNNVASASVLRLYGAYWTVRDLILTHAQKGVVLDGADFGEVVNVEVYNVGYEAIHVLNGCQNAVIEGCFVHDTGLVKPGFGEGVYVGSDKGAWDEYDRDVKGTIVRNCTIGPNVAAEAFDIKEGTSETIIEYNTVDATGISGVNYADSFLDLKGTRTYVRFNHFYRQGAPKLTRAIGIIDRGVELSSYEHVIHDNYFFLDNEPVDLIKKNSGVGEVYVFDNEAAAGAAIPSGIHTVCCPSWYTPPDQEAACNVPAGRATSAISNSSALLEWTGHAANFTVSYARHSLFEAEQHLTVASSPILLDALAPATVYEWRVRANCADKQSAFSPLLTFVTLSGPPPPDAADILYDDALRPGWTDYSFDAAVDFSNTADLVFGARSIRCSYGSYGGLNFKHDTPFDATHLSSISFWAKGDLDTNGPAHLTLRLKLDAAEYDFPLTNGEWNQYLISLAHFGNPSTLERVVLQSRSGSPRLVYFDQIQFLGAEETSYPPTLLPTRTPTASPLAPVDNTLSPTGNPTVQPTTRPTSSPIPPNSQQPSRSPTSSPISSPTVQPTSKPSSTPTTSPIPSPTVQPTSKPTSSPTISPIPSPTVQPTSKPTNIPTPSSGSSIAVYRNTLDSAWNDFSYKGSFNFASPSNLPGAFTTSIQASLNAWGAINLKHNDNGLDSNGLTSLDFYIKGNESGYPIRVKVNGKRVTINTLDTWEHHSIDLGDVSSPDAVESIQFQNGSSSQRTIHVGNIEFV